MRGLRFSLAVAISLLATAAHASANTDITISSGLTTGGNFAAGVFTPTGPTANISTTDLQNQLAINNVTINAVTAFAGTGNITFNNALTWTSANSLTLNTSGAGTITQAAPISGAAALFAANAAAPITLGNALNDFGTLTAVTTGANPITATDSNAITLGSVNSGGAFTLQAGGPVSQSAAATVSGVTSLTASGSAITLSNGGNNFVGPVSIAGPASAASLNDQNALDLGTVNVTGNLTALAGGGALTQSGPITAGGQTDAEGQSVTLANPNNNFNQAQFAASGGGVDARDANAITLTSTTATGSAQVVAGTNLSVTGNPNANALTLVADEAAGAGVGPGALTIAPGATLTSGGAPVRLYSSKRSQNSIGAGATFNGSAFVPGTEFADTDREKWGVHFPAGTAVNPFTFFYKDTPDTTPPETSIDVGPAAGSTIANPTPSFTFSSSEAGSTFECSADGSAFAACTSPTSVGPLADGQHSFAVRATDAAGNTDPTPAGRAFFVDTGPADKTPPDTVIAKKPKRTVKTTKKKVKVSFEFRSSETGSAFECSLDGVAYKPCTSPWRVKVAEGPHYVFIRATDAAGNKDATPARADFKVKRKKRKRRHQSKDVGVDVTPPDATFIKTPEKRIFTTKQSVAVEFTFLSNEARSHFECAREGGTFEPCSSPYDYRVGEGWHFIMVRAVDAAGNADPSPDDYLFKVKRTRDRR